MKEVYFYSYLYQGKAGEITYGNGSAMCSTVINSDDASVLISNIVKKLNAEHGYPCTITSLSKLS